MNNLKDIHNVKTYQSDLFKLFYQDFNEQFEGYTQQGIFLVRKWLVISSDIRRSDSSTLILSRSNTAILIVGIGVTCDSDVIGDTNIIILILLQNYKKCMKYTNFCENILHISKKITTFAPTNLKDIHNKDYSVV